MKSNAHAALEAAAISLAGNRQDASTEKVLDTAKVFLDWLDTYSVE